MINKLLMFIAAHLCRMRYGAENCDMPTNQTIVIPTTNNIIVTHLPAIPPNKTEDQYTSKEDEFKPVTQAFAESHTYLILHWVLIAVKTLAGLLLPKKPSIISQVFKEFLILILCCVESCWLAKNT